MMSRALLRAIRNGALLCLLATCYKPSLFALVPLVVINVYSGSGQSGNVSTVLPGPLVAQVLALDGNGNPTIPLQGAIVTFSVASPQNGAILSPSSAVTASDGTASTNLTLGNQSGQYQVMASCYYPCAQIGPNATFTETATSASNNLAIYGNTNNQQGNVGTKLPLQVLVTNQAGAPVSGESITFTITQQPQGAVGASLSVSNTATAADGTASTQLTFGNLAGQYQVTASCAAGNCLPNTAIFTETATGCQVSVPGVSQFDGRWGGDPYDHLGSDSKGPLTIARRGCALTSLTMALDFAGPLASGAYTSWDPGSLPPGGKHSLNSLLNLNGGYVTRGRVDWLTATRVAAEGTTLMYDNLGGTFDSDQDLADAELAVEIQVCEASQPVIVGVRSPTTGKYPGHFVLITGEIVNPDGTKAFSINDPAGHSAVLGNTFYTNINGQPEFQTRGIVSDPPDLSGLSVSIDAIASLIVTGPNGQLAGFDPVTGNPVQQIPHSAAAIDEIDDDVTGDAGNPVQNVTVNSPAEGIYTATATGAGSGTYTLTFSALATDGTIQNATATGNTEPGSKSTYILQYSSSPGSPPTITPMPGDRNGDGVVNCADIAIVKASFGKKMGDPGFDPRADANVDGIVNVVDLAIVSKGLSPGTKCP